jgi:hypothetical protein
MPELTSTFSIIADVFSLPVLYHQPEKMAKSKEDLATRQAKLEQLKQEHGIE